MIISILFLTSKIWLGDDRQIQKDNYNQLLEIGSYNIKFSEAEYIREQNLFKVKYNIKSMIENNSNSLGIRIFSGKVTEIKQPLKYELDKINDIAYWIYVYDVPTNYYYINIELSSEKDIPSSESTDVFGNKTDKVKKDERIIKLVKIDYRLV